MIQAIREKISGWFAGVIVVLLSVSFVAWGIQAYLQSENGNGMEVAKVGDTVISRANFQAIYQNQLRYFSRMSKQPLSLTEQHELRKNLLQSLIAQAAMNNGLHDLGMTAGSEQIKNKIMALPFLQQHGQFSTALLQQYLYGTGQSLKQLQAQTAAQIVSSQLQQAMQMSSFVLPNELKQGAALLNQKRTFSYTLLKPSMFASRVKFSANKLRAYYQQNKAQYTTPEKVQLQYVILSPDHLRSKVKITQAELKSYYQANQQNYQLPTRWQVQEIKVPVLAGASETVAKRAKAKVDGMVKKLVDGTAFDKLTKNKPRWIMFDDVPATYQSVLTRLKVGQVSVPFRTPAGYTIVKLIKLQVKHIKPFKDVEKSLRSALMAQKLEGMFSNEQSSLSNIAFTNPGSLVPVAKALNIKVQTSPVLTKQGASKGLFANAGIVKTAFSDEVLAQSNNSQPITLKDGSVMVLRVKQHWPQTLQPFEKIESQVRRDYVSEQSKVIASKTADMMVTALQSGQSLNAQQKKYGIRWSVKRDVSQHEKNISPVLLKAVFALTTQTGSSARQVELTNGDIAVVKLQAINLAKSSSKDLMLGMRLRGMQAQVLSGLLQHHFKRSADVKIFNKALK